MLLAATHMNERVRNGGAGRNILSRQTFENYTMWHPRSWRNWKTRPAQTRVPYAGMQVQLLPSAPSTLTRAVS